MNEYEKQMIEAAKQFSESGKQIAEKMMKDLGMVKPLLQEQLKKTLESIQYILKSPARDILLCLLASEVKKRQYKAGEKVFGFIIRKHKVRGCHKFFARKKVKGKDYRVYLGEDLNPLEVETRIKSYCEKHGIPIA